MLISWLSVSVVNQKMPWLHFLSRPSFACPNLAVSAIWIAMSVVSVVGFQGEKDARWTSIGP